MLLRVLGADYCASMLPAMKHILEDFTWLAVRIDLFIFVVSLSLDDEVAG